VLQLLENFQLSLILNAPQSSAKYEQVIVKEGVIKSFLLLKMLFAESQSKKVSFVQPYSDIKNP